MIRASVAIHIPSRTVVSDDVPCLGLDKDEDDAAELLIDIVNVPQHAAILSHAKSH